MKISQERLYILANDEKSNELHLAMMAKVGIPDENAKVQYNGTEHALFFRDSEKTIVFDFIPEQVRPLVRKAKVLHIVETLSDFQTVIRKYDIAVQQSESPYPKNILDSIQMPEKVK